MNATDPLVSVIIPTHNRKDSLRQVLNHLCRQTFPVAQMELLIVADACSDGTIDMVHNYTAPFALRVIEQPGLGAGAARNRGAGAAAGTILVFIDDDIYAAPGMIAAHVNAHGNARDRVVLGYLSQVIQEQLGFYQTGLRYWWETTFYTMSQPGYRHTYKSLLSGNFSINAEMFRRVGGFDPIIRCREDYELGARLISAGASFVLAANAHASHNDITDIARALGRKFQEGRGDVMIGQRHPDLLPDLLFKRIHDPLLLPSRLLHFITLYIPSIGDQIAHAARRLLKPLEWARLFSIWRRLCEGLYIYWYSRGAIEELGSRQTAKQFLRKTVVPDHKNIVEIDLSLGIHEAQKMLDCERPDGALIRYGTHRIGSIPPEPGAERLHSGHLRPILATKLAWPLICVLATEGICDTPSNQGFGGQSDE